MLRNLHSRVTDTLRWLAVVVGSVAATVVTVLGLGRCA